jgi:hypothetical protein
MFMRFPRTNPAKVKCAASAMAMPESSAAAREATIGKPTFAALKTMSPDKRPLEARKHSLKSVWFSAATPIALSTALCLPTS